MRADIRWLDDPEVFRINRLNAHSDHGYYQNYEELDTEKSSLIQSLNGVWDFCFSKNPKCRPDRFYEPDFDWRGFEKIRVPGHIELAGYDQIRYINTMYPWEGKSYRRGAYSLKNTGAGKGMFSEAEYNPVGSYVKRFDLDEGLRKKSVRICFEGVEQAMYVWLNGNFIGYAEDSFTPSEFDLTPFIKEKDNLLAVEVYKTSTAAFLEDQDFFRFFGIFRNVTLKAIPRAHIEDLWLHPILKNDCKNGEIHIKVKAVAAKDEQLHVRFLLKDRKGDLILKEEFRLKENDREYTGQLHFPMKNVNVWDQQDPYLYHAVLELMDEGNTLLEIVPYSVGFRKIEIIDRVIYLNGKRLKLLGVNRHEWSARTGRCIGMEEMRKDRDCMIRNHINAVRTCHYPNQIPWYFLCDESGLYVMSETNLESHGTFQKLGVTEPSCNIPGSLPQWKEAVLDRAKTHFETFKNHPSIIFWSLGNESYAGEDIAAMHAWFKAQKDGRLVHYEGVFHNRTYEDRISDVESHMYSSPETVEAYLKNEPKKPFLLCEFMHDMGNSMGGLGSYMRLFDLYEMYHGGFLWDLIDQALFVKDEVTGKEVLRYGGDFDDRPSDYEFSGNGILFADRKEKPAMQEVAYYYGMYR